MPESDGKQGRKNPENPETPEGVKPALLIDSSTAPRGSDFSL
jgi:hypothetical protein